MGSFLAHFDDKYLVGRKSVNGVAMMPLFCTELRTYPSRPRNGQSCSALAGTGILVVAVRFEGKGLIPVSPTIIPRNSWLQDATRYLAKSLDRRALDSFVTMLAMFAR